MRVGATTPQRVPGRDELARLPARVIHPGSPTKASIRVFLEAGRPPGDPTDARAGELPLVAPFVVKDVRPLHPLVRWLYGKRVLRREERALAALADVEGVPRLLGRVDEDALALEYVAAEPLRRQLGPERLRQACLGLPARVAALHARGVVHLDLRQKRNVLVDAAGGVFLVDFGSSVVRAAGGPGALLFRWLARFDDGAVLKYRSRYVPDLLSAAELARARRTRWLGRLWFFHRFGPLLRWIFGRKRQRSP